MDAIQQALSKLADPARHNKIAELFTWILKTFPTLKVETKWNQPMFLDHGTFIIGFSFAKDHFSVAVEYDTLQKFQADIIKSGYAKTTMLFQVKWKQDIDYDLFKRIIETNIKEKAAYTTFWR